MIVGGIESQKVYISDCSGFRADQHGTRRRGILETPPELEGLWDWAIMNGVMPSLAAQVTDILLTLQLQQSSLERIASHGEAVITHSI